jgi:hypothetical protein
MRMKRRRFLALGIGTALAAVCYPRQADAHRNRKFVFKIKTKSGGIIGNIVIEAKDAEAAKHKLRERYPDCEILEMEEK